MNDTVKKLVIAPDVSVKEAFKRIDEGGIGVLFICDREGRLLGSLTDGDIRRRFLKSGTLHEVVANSIKPDPIFVIKGNYTNEEARELMLEKVIEAVPVLDEDRKIVDVLFWTDIFKEANNNRLSQIDIPVVIMAGGKGERLGPFTKILPKPLMPLGDKPIIEIIMDRFKQHGIGRFFVTLNYKGRMIEAYLSGIDKDFSVKYVWEKEYLGTAASLKLIEDDLGDAFIVSNCDILVNIDYADLVKFHHSNNNVLTVTGSMQHHKIPYGVIHFEKEGRINRIQEKPEYDFMVNTGLYILSKEAVGYIPDNEYFDMTELLQKLLDSKKNVGVYPISQKSYVDIGQLNEYKKTVEQMDMVSK